MVENFSMQNKSTEQAKIKQTTLCYIEKDNCYLMLHRNKKENDPNKNKWIAVGGKFEAGESPEDCMRREVLEETGLKVLSWRYGGIVTFLSNIWETEMMHLFVCKEWEGNLKPCDEGQLEWIPKEDLLSLPMWAGDRIFLKLLQTDAPFFSLKLRYENENLVLAELNGKPFSAGETEVYRHFKGNLYRVLGVAYDSEDLTEKVVYRALYGEHKLWVRDKKMFFEKTERDGQEILRFQPEPFDC